MEFSTFFAAFLKGAVALVATFALLGGLALLGAWAANMMLPMA